MQIYQQTLKFINWHFLCLNLSTNSKLYKLMFLSLHNFTWEITVSAAYNFARWVKDIVWK